MTTDRQREANRRNADKSTGPRTPEGKETVSRNAIKHGLLSQRVVLAVQEAICQRLRLRYPWRLHVEFAKD